MYLRLKKEETVETIPEDVLQECCQLVKEHSIEGKILLILTVLNYFSGKKKDFVKIVYTPFLNLHKAQSMDVGAVGFHSEKKVSLVL